MIYLFFGENDYAITQATHRVLKQATAEYFDGGMITREQLADICTGATLFVDKRFVVIKNLSANKEIWSEAVYFFERVDDGTTIILLESTLDRRLSTYRWLAKNAQVREYNLWTARNRREVTEWLQQEASRLSLSLTASDAAYLLERVGYNQWHLKTVIDKSMLVGDISRETIDMVTDATSHDTAYELFNTIISGDRQRLHDLISSLRLKEEPYLVLALLASQVTTLAAIITEKGKGRNIAGDLGIHPFVVQKLQAPARHLSLASVRELLAIFATADIRMKSVDADPWTVVEYACMQAAMMNTKNVPH